MQKQINSFFGIRDEVPALHATLYALIPIVFVLIVWFLCTIGPPESRIINIAILPSPMELIQALIDLIFHSPEKNLGRSITVSLTRILCGFFIASVIAIPLGIAMGAFCRIEKMFSSLILVGSYIPIPTLVPLTIAWFGTNDEQKICFLAIASFVYLLPAVVQAINDVDDIFINTGYTIGATKLQIVLKILLPIALPKIYDSMRMGIGVGFTWIIMAEMIGADSGLGYLLNQARTRGGIDATATVFAILLIIIAIAFLIDQILKRFHKELFPYKEK